MAFDVKIESFEGPFDLLLGLIMKQELDIQEVPISQITAAYLEHVEALPEFDLDSATEFLLIAATLLYIKAHSLLPSPEDEIGAAEEAGDALEYLAERLIEYKQFSNAAEWLAGAYAVHGLFSPRLRELEEDYACLYPDPFEGVSIESLPEALMELLMERAPFPVDTTYIAHVRISVAKHIQIVRERLSAEEETTFGKLIEGYESKLEVIATFLAVLELYKEGELKLSQRRPFGEIAIKKLDKDESSAA